MTYAPVKDQARYKSYQEYLDDESLSPDANYRLLSAGDLIEVASEDDINLRIALRLLLQLAQIDDGILADRIRNGNKELEVRPVGDKWVNRIPDLMVVQPEHLEHARKAILLDMVPPLFVAEVVSPGGESSDNYQRDYVWKRQQYEDLGIPEDWIIDPHRAKVTVLTLSDDGYDAEVYATSQNIVSSVFPTLSISVKSLLVGNAS